MIILAIGDIVGTVGCEHLRRVLPRLKKERQVDLVIANGENSADRNGISPSSADHIFQSGVDVITTGNHAFRRRDIYERFEEDAFLLRPANYPSSAPGKGICVVDKGYVKVCVLNLSGTVFLESLRCPFETADELLTRTDGAKIVLVDFHAEATAEKKALGYYLDGRVSAVYGTHTHVPTADETILPKGTGFLTDIGMTGPRDSVLGVKAELSIRKMKDKLPVFFEYADGPCIMQGVLMQVDEKSGICRKIERISVS